MVTEETSVPIAVEAKKQPEVQVEPKTEKSEEKK